jgi:hypothetical protein
VGDAAMGAPERLALATEVVSPTSAAYGSLVRGPTTTSLGESTVSVSSGAGVRIEGDDVRGWTVLVEMGSVDFDVTPRGSRPDFVVRAGEISVRVVGTRFNVTRGAEQVNVAVREGSVRIQGPNGPVVLNAGDSWPDARVESVPASPKPDRSGRTAKARRGRAQASSRAADAADRAFDFERATRLEQSDPKQALRLYRGLAQGSDPWAANSLYAQARLLWEAGERAAARRLLQRYLDRHPGGANASDARRLLAAGAAVGDAHDVK